MRDEQILKMYVAPDKAVWAAAAGPPSKVATSVGAMLSEWYSAALSVIRVLGTHDNAQLITELYPLCVPRGLRLELATPAVCTPAELTNPDLVVYRMRQCQLPVSVGGWHVATDEDYQSYVLASEFQQRPDEYTNRAKQAFSLHPATRALRFIPTLWEKQAARLLGHLRDPRWYIDPNHPDRAARLHMYLGLSPGIFRASLLDPERSKQTSRCRIAMQAWSGSQGNEEADLDNPANFLWRVAHAARKHPLLRATTLFATYLFYSWLDAIRRDPAWQQEPLFAPERIFKVADELAAYQAYAGRS